VDKVMPASVTSVTIDISNNLLKNKKATALFLQKKCQQIVLDLHG
jgi:hypothetical protein